jgi:type IV pilus assembly protein PilY1
VTTRPELGDPKGNTSNSLSGTGNPGVYVATGRYLGTTDLDAPVKTQIQTIYGLKDDLSRTGTAAYIGNPRAPEPGFGSFVRQYIYQPTTISRTTSKNAVNWTINGGWYADLQVFNSTTGLVVTPSPSVGERVRLDPHLVSGTLSVISTVPGGSACTIGGTSWKYSFDFMNGQNITNHDVGALINEGAEGSVVVQVGGLIKEIITLTGGDAITEDTWTKGTGPTRRTSWRELLTQ